MHRAGLEFGAWKVRTGTSRKDVPSEACLAAITEVLACHLCPKPPLAHPPHSLKGNESGRICPLCQRGSGQIRTTSRWLGNETALGWFLTCRLVPGIRKQKGSPQPVGRQPASEPSLFRVAQCRM